MSQDIPIAEHLDRIRRVESVPCPKCYAPKGRPCTGPGGNRTEPHHASRYAKLYPRKGKTP